MCNISWAYTTNTDLFDIWVVWLVEALDEDEQADEGD